ncbi:MAG: hypothetical protein MI750_03650 [Xanthomonadales bacterium]|nr:hypothetical protein [Xanthomonadales bacterium]
MLFSTAITIITVMMLAWLLSPTMRENPQWQATVTPLASIVGSGFLIIAPLLYQIAGVFSVLVMLLIVLLASGLGRVMRHNIQHVEPMLRRRPAKSVLGLERISDFSLLFAYLISVAFYLSLLSAFVLRLWPSAAAWSEGQDMITTALLVFIGVQGFRGGLGALEHLEEYSVSIKLAIIVALLFALGSYFVQSPLSTISWQWPQGDWWYRIRLIAGTLLVIQGFETSRYLGQAYEWDMRCRSMRSAQRIAAGIYLLFVVLMVPLLYGNGGVAVEETAIIDLAVQVASILGPLLLLAAIMSQFSAAVADTLGAGGLAGELIPGRGRGRERYRYLVFTAAAVVLVWLSDVFELISLASRAFALYYLVQCLLALRVMQAREQQRSLAYWATVALALVMGFVVLFALPVESL